MYAYIYKYTSQEIPHIINSNALHIYRYNNPLQFCQYQIKGVRLMREFDNNLVQMYLVELEIKDTTDSNTSYLDVLLSIGRDGQLHTSIYDVTISISISQNFSSCVAIYQLHPPIASLSHSLYDMH